MLGKDTKMLLDKIYERLKSEGSYREMFNGDYAKGKLPEVSSEKIKEAYLFADEIKEEIRTIYEKGGISHEDDMYLKTMQFYADTGFFAGGCENPVFPEYIDLNCAIAPNNSPLYFINDITAIRTEESYENSIRYLNLIKEYPLMVQGCLERVRSSVKN